MTDRSESLDLCLSEADAQAVERLFANRLDVARASVGLNAADADRLRRVAQVLGLLEDPIAEQSFDSALIDATLARIEFARRHSDLGAEDADALEVLINHEYNSSKTPRVMRQCAAKIESLLGLLDPLDSVTDGRDERVERVLVAVQASIDLHESRITLGDRISRGAMRFRDIAAAAAILLLGTALLLPIMSGIRSQAQRYACIGNLGAAGTGFGLYANDHREMMPMASDSKAGVPWWNIGRVAESNSANLYVLVGTEYTTLDALACPGNQRARVGTAQPGAVDWGSIEEISYSYQNMYAADRPRWTGRKWVVISDRSPVVLRARRDGWVNPFENSPNHDALGQNVLMSDGSASWHTTPIIGTDNIWLPRQLEQILSGRSDPWGFNRSLDGTESPDGADDAMMTP